MSKQAVVEFLQAVANNDALAEKLRAAEDYAQVTVIGSENGYTFTEADLITFKQEQVQNSLNNLDRLDELSDEKLEAVAGGSFTRGKGNCTDMFPMTCIVEKPKETSSCTGFQPGCP